MSKVSIIIYTNESYLDLLDLTLPSVLKSFEHIDLKFYLVSNKITTELIFEKVTQIDCGVDFSSDGSHFQKTLLFALDKIDCEIVLFLCDDYFFKSKTKKEVFDSLVNLMIDYDIDYLSLGTQKHMEGYLYNWDKLSFNSKEYNLPSEIIYFMDKNYRHLYSVQPSLWKKKSLQKILLNNNYLTLHDLDNSNIKDCNGLKRSLDQKKNYMFYINDPKFQFFTDKNICLHKPPLTYHVDEKSLDSDYFVIDYIEIIRHGKFINAEVNSKFILKNLLLNSEDISDKLSKFN